MNLHNAQFVKSAVEETAFIRDALPQIVFAGRSNVGKSSVINRLLNRKNFARVGASPGKTVHINYFNIDQSMYFVDIPGYGYAKVSQQEKARWAALIEAYFASEMITHGVLIVDIRHKPTEDDTVMADWFLQSGVGFTVVANKLDKIKKSDLADSLNTIKTALRLPGQVQVIPFSAEKGDGRQVLWDAILHASEYREKGK